MECKQCYDFIDGYCKNINKTIDNSGKCIKSVGKKELSKMRVISTLSQESLKYLTCVKNKRQNKMLNSPNDINIIPRHDPFATPKEKRR